MGACRLGIGGFLLGLAGMGHAQSVQDPDGAHGLKSVQQAIESSSVQVVTDDAGQPRSIVVRSCNTCEPERFLVSESLTFHQGGERLSVQEAAEQSGWPGTVIYKTDSEMAQKVIFFAR